MTATLNDVSKEEAGRGVGGAAGCGGAGASGQGAAAVARGYGRLLLAAIVQTSATESPMTRPNA